MVTVKVSPSRTAARAWSRPGRAGAGQSLVQVDAIGGHAERGELLALGVRSWLVVLHLA